MAERITITEREPYPGQQWKCGDEFLPFHPQASHIDPAYRDGWNRCYWMAVARGIEVSAEPLTIAEPGAAGGELLAEATERGVRIEIEQPWRESYAHMGEQTDVTLTAQQAKALARWLLRAAP